jgi:hypothetical protein
MPALSQSLTFTIGTSTTVAVVYPNTGTTTMVYTSNPAKGDGYFGGSDGFHTVMYTTTPNFVGTVTMQATLATEPLESDWFNVADTNVSYTTYDGRSTTSVDLSNFTGNFVWVRGHVSIYRGTVSSILYNH